jgi:hypothetical protein
VISNESLPEPQPRKSSLAQLLEWATAAVLILVLAALGSMAAGDRLPEALRLPSVNAAILVVLGLLTAALLLVSVLALLHTTQDHADKTRADR